MAGETPVDIAYTHAKESVAGQRARLDNLRTRATALVTAASVIASFLGGQALSDTKTANGQTVADRSLQCWEAIAFVAFFMVLGLCAFMIAPKRDRPARERKNWHRPARKEKKGWLFRLNANSILKEAGAIQTSRPDLTPDAVAQIYKRQLAGNMEGHYKANEPSIKRRFRALIFGIIALGIEALAFVADLI